MEILPSPDYTDVQRRAENEGHRDIRISPDSIDMEFSVIHDICNGGLDAGMGASSPKHAAELKQYVDRCGARGLACGLAPLRVLDGFAGKWRRFRHGPGLLCGFRRGLFAVGLADLGKRRRVAVFRAGSACETAQKLQAGFARAEGSASKHVFQSRRRWSQVLRLLSCVR